jgi:hypothetical protein
MNPVVQNHQIVFPNELASVHACEFIGSLMDNKKEKGRKFYNVYYPFCWFNLYLDNEELNYLILLGGKFR